MKEKNDPILESSLSDFTKAVIKVILAIPKGKVMSYRDVAAKAGNYRAARQVARILHSLSDKYKLPWHRVINAKGQIAITNPLGFEIQKKLLETEGVEVDELGRVDFKYMIK